MAKKVKVGPSMGMPVGPSTPDELIVPKCPRPNYRSESAKTASPEVIRFLKDQKIDKKYWNSILGADGGGGFLRGQCSVGTLPPGTVVVRYFGTAVDAAGKTVGRAAPMGRWWNRAGVVRDPVKDCALPKENPGLGPVVCRVKPGKEVPILMGRGAPRCENKPGGTEQLFIPNPSEVLEGCRP